MTRPGTGRRRAALAATAMILLLPGGPVRGGEVPLPLTLAEALEIAGKQNPDLAAAREQAASQAAQAEAVGRGAWPRLSLATGWSRSDNPALVFAQKLNAGEFTQEDFALARLNAPGALSHQTTVLALEVPLDVFGKVRSRASGERALGRAAGAAAREAALEVSLRVVEAYRRAVLARRAVAVTEGAVAGARGREAEMDARVGEGAALAADLLRARARRRQREADAAGSRADAAAADAVLARLLGAPAGTLYEPTDAAPAPVPLAGDEAERLAQAREGRPALAAARERLEAARWALRVQRRAWLPDVGVYGQAQDDRSRVSGGERSGVAGAVVRWSVFDPGRGKAVDAAEAGERAAERELQAAEDQVRLEVVLAWRRAGAARERHAAAAGGAEEGREALRVVRERRQAGMATLTDELETDAASLAAELEEIRAAAEAAVADAALARATGEAP